MKCLSIRQPWAWAILHANKDVENRTWYTGYQGPLLIHAGQKADVAGWREFVRWHDRILPPGLLPHNLPGGVVLGVVRLVDCVDDSPSPWAEEGLWHWLLADRIAFDEPVPWRGQLGLFDVPLAGLPPKVCAAAERAARSERT